MSMTDEPAIQCFISYAHADDVILEFIEPYKNSLKHFAFADRGRVVDFFVDRESIGWGDDWKHSIKTSINTATVFMPVITRQYFDRPSCREELLTFYNEANTLGVGSLFLPVVLMGHSYVSTESQDIAARIVAERQYRDLKEAWLEGPKSSVWRRTMMNLASELVNAADAAENSLTSASLSPVGGNSAVASIAADDDDAPGAAEVGVAVEHFGEKLQATMTEMTVSIHEFADIANSYSDLEGKPKEELRKAILEVAAKIKEPGLQFQQSARELESSAVETDGLLRRYVEYLSKNGSEDQKNEAKADFKSAAGAMEPLKNADKMMVNFLDQIRPLEVLSAPLRQSLRGFRVGATAVNSALAIMQSWPELEA